MKKFRYKFSPLVITLLCVGIILAIAVIVTNIVRFSAAKYIDTYSIVTLICTLAIAFFTIVIIISIIFWSNFIVTEKQLILRWGILAQKLELSSIIKLVKLENSNKLVVYYKTAESDDNFMKVFINTQVFDDFSNYIVSKNKDIIIEMTNG